MAWEMEDQMLSKEWTSRYTRVSPMYSVATGTVGNSGKGVVEEKPYQDLN